MANRQRRGFTPAFKGCVLRDISANCTPITLSKHGGADRAWPYDMYHRGFVQQIGDYQESGDFWDSATGKFRFLAHYIEATPAADVLRFAVVETSP